MYHSVAATVGSRAFVYVHHRILLKTGFPSGNVQRTLLPLRMHVLQNLNEIIWPCEDSLYPVLNLGLERWVL